MKICDLHGFHFEDGKDKIISVLNLCIQESETEIQFIHGYHGHSFKDYIQSSQFLQDMEEEGFTLTLTKIHSKNGVTEFRVENIMIPFRMPDSEVRLMDYDYSNASIPKKKMSLDEAKAFFLNQR